MTLFRVVHNGRREPSFAHDYKSHSDSHLSDDFSCGVRELAMSTDSCTILQSGSLHLGRVILTPNRIRSFRCSKSELH